MTGDAALITVLAVLGIILSGLVFFDRHGGDE